MSWDKYSVLSNKALLLGLKNGLQLYKSELSSTILPHYACHHMQISLPCYHSPQQHFPSPPQLHFPSPPQLHFPSPPQLSPPFCNYFCVLSDNKGWLRCTAGNIITLVLQPSPPSSFPPPPPLCSLYRLVSAGEGKNALFHTLRNLVYMDIDW